MRLLRPRSRPRRLWLILPVLFVGGYCTGAIRPPRPFFSNHYVLTADHPPWPHWQPPAPMGHPDAFGQRLWIDTRDNVILLALTGRTAADHDQTRLVGATTQATLFMGDFGDITSIRIPRVRDVLIVASPDRHLHSFPVPGGTAQRVQEKCTVPTSGGFDLLERLQAELPTPARTGLTTATANYTRPATRLTH